MPFKPSSVWMSLPCVLQMAGNFALGLHLGISRGNICCLPMLDATKHCMQENRQDTIGQVKETALCHPVAFNR